MDAIKIPKEQVVPIDTVAEGVHGLRILFVNVYGLEHANGSWTLIDAGLPFSAQHIHSWAEKQFDKAPNAILLTHGHFDHASAAGELAGRWNVPIYAHALERPYLTGQREYPPPNFAAGGGMMSLLSPLLPRGPVNFGDRLRDLPMVTQGWPEIAEAPGWQIVHTPGHTRGHVSLFRIEDRTLLPGDAFCTTKPESFFEAAVAQRAELHGPPAYFTEDWPQAERSVELLATFDPTVVAPGHGRSIAGQNTAAELRELAKRFKEVAVPENRKSPAA